jgi:CO/xanthine dehydrogenase Mo-binding subunit
MSRSACAVFSKKTGGGHDMNIVSKSMAKIDGMDLATGKPAYVDDLCPKEALCVKILRSPHAFAKIVTIDIEDASKVAGVACVLTHADVPGIRHTIALESYPESSPYDRLILENLVRCVGDPVAIVAAEDERTAAMALQLIKVEYEALEPVLDFEQAEGNLQIIHPESDIVTNFNIGLDARRNVASSRLEEIGDIERVLNECEVVVEHTYYTQAQAHSMLETHRAFTFLDRGRLVIVTSTQSPFHVQRLVAQSLGLPANRLRVIKPRIGGGFGGKNKALVEVFPALVTLKTGKPAKIIYSRQECFNSTTSRHAMRGRVVLGADRSGDVRAIDLQVLTDTGAYGEDSADVLVVASHNVLPIYGGPKSVRYRGTAVYTNKMPGGAFRGFGAPQSVFALESVMNELAAELKMDPTQLRLKNTIKLGQAHPFLGGSQEGKPAVVNSSTLDQCIERGKALICWDQKYPRREVEGNRVRGVGMAIAMHGTGIARVDTAAATIQLNYDGGYKLLVGASDLGTGADTILAQMAAEVLATSLENIIVYSADTDLTPYDSGAYASSTTYVTGNAVVKAARLLREEIVRGCAAIHGKSVDDLELDGQFLRTVDGAWEIPLPELAKQLVSATGKQQPAATATFGGDGSPPPYVAGFAEVEVDLETGKLDLLNFVDVIDCGTVINPNLARIQAEGGIAQGIGQTLFEDMRFDDRGEMLTDSFMKYKIPCRKDVGQILVEFLPSLEPTGPFGAKSIGEVVVHTTAPAIADALFNATGVRIRRLPITPEKVFKGLQQKWG